MRGLLIAGLLALAGCAAQPPAVVSLESSSQAGPIVVATLATSACELETAPVYTAATLEVQRAVRALRAARVSADEADALFAIGVRAREALDAACLAGAARADAEQLATARAAVSAMQSILGGAR